MWQDWKIAVQQWSPFSLTEIEQLWQKRTTETIGIQMYNADSQLPKNFTTATFGGLHLRTWLDTFGKSNGKNPEHSSSQGQVVESGNVLQGG